MYIYLGLRIKILLGIMTCCPYYFDIDTDTLLPARCNINHLDSVSKHSRLKTSYQVENNKKYSLQSS